MPKDSQVEPRMLLDRARALAQAGRLAEARDVTRRLCRTHRHDAGVWLLLGAISGRMGLLEDAVRCCRRVIKLDATNPDAHYNLGTALQQLGRLRPAIAAYQSALRLNPMHSDACNNVGNSLRALGKVEEALRYFDQALQIDPGHARAHCNRSLLSLLMGDYERGWEEFEWRWSRPEHPPRRFPHPEWKGEPLRGRTILVHAEQGYGDTLQFIRYIPKLKEQGASVLFECPPPLARLLEGFPGIGELTLQGKPLPYFDLHVPILSLPRLFRTTLGTIPAQSAYLTAPPDRRPEIDRLLEAADPGPRIGVVWAGNPIHVNDRNRSCPARHLNALATIPSAHLVSLQKGLRARDLADGGVPAVDLAPLLNDFGDTAYALARLDLLVTVDTAAAHLGGALGRPTCVLLPFDPDWRWLLGRNDSPWYPSVRLFRQPARGDWAGALRALCDYLEEWSSTC